MNDKIQNWKDTTWQTLPVLHMPELHPEAVQFAMFESDPIEDYRKILIQSRDRFRRELRDEEDSKQRELLKRAQMTGTWDGLFKSIAGDRVYLLVPSRSRTNESLTRVTVISSNSPEGRKWLTTKIGCRDNMPTCWCIPVETAIGNSVQVELRNENAFDPQNLYDELIESI